MVDPKSFSLLTHTKTEKFVILGLGLILSDQSQFSVNAWLRLKKLISTFFLFLKREKMAKVIICCWALLLKLVCL